MCVCLCVCMYVFVCLCVYVCTFIYREGFIFVDQVGYQGTDQRRYVEDGNFRC